MYLSGLELYGFKSFPNRTKLTFDPGVMAIVGPNGCGKSNLVDAVRWVLGEQRAGVLRSDKMENVIFAGTGKRKQSPYSEVTLVVENTHGLLPAEYGEVAITRKLNRNGDSEYLLNRRPCRLKDIRNLFADTGLGPDSYSIIELSMVESILSGRPEERRRLFEEAAGVTLYKSRLKTARRRLLATKTDLDRVEDLKNEIESQRNSLKRQVAKARRYRWLSTALRVKELKAADEEVKDLRSRLTPLEKRILNGKKEKEELEKFLRTSEDKISRLRGKLTALEEEVAEKSRKRSDIEGSLQALQKEIVVLEERIRSTEQRTEERDKNEAELIRRQATIAEEITQLDEEYLKAEERLNNLKLELEVQDENWRVFENRLEKSREQKSGAEKTFRESERQLLNANNEARHIETKLENLTNRLDQIQAEERRLEIPDDPSSLREELEIKEKNRQRIEDELELTLGELEKIREEKSALTSEIAKYDSSIKALDRRISMLQSMIVDGEGRPKAVKSLLKGKYKGLIGRLGDAVSVDEKYQFAVNAALEGAASAVVIDDKTGVHEAGLALLEGKSGRGSILLQKSGESKNELPEARRQGLIQLVKYVNFSGKAGKYAQAILENFWLVENLPELLDKADLAGTYNISLVTLDGCRLTPDGILNAGEIDKGDLGASHLLDEASKERTDLEQSLNKTQEALKIIKEKELEKSSSYQQNQGLRKNLAIELEKLRKDLNHAEAEWKTYKALEQKRSQEKDELEKNISVLESEREEARIFANNIAEEFEEHNKIFIKAENELKEVEAESDELRQQRDSLRHQQVEASANAEKLKGEVRRRGTLLDEIKRSLSTINSERAGAENALEDTEIRLQNVKSEARIIEEEFNIVRQNLDFSQKKYDATRRDFSEQEGLISEKRVEFERLSDTLHTTELEISEFTHRLSSIRARILENYELDILSGPQENLPLAVEDDNPYMNKLLGDIREALKTIGPVNQMAVEEYDVVDRRWQTLIVEYEDLVEARDAFEETIKEINTVARRRFMETFNRVEGNFVKLFVDLFGGGEAKLVLEDGDPLEAGIRIFATPKGKKLSSIELLSGGEKALTAIALLFSLYLERPSPFCFLDEVDAPLDDSNVVRFCRLLREFTDRTQFLVVTHNKLTMEQANRLYGVTMEEEGVSRLVAVEIAQSRSEEVA